MPVVIGIAVLAALVLVLAGVREAIHLVSAYPVQFWMFVTAVIFLAVGTGAALHRVNKQVPWAVAPKAPREPLSPPPARALRAAPVLTAIATAPDEDARDCEGPECGNKVDDDPYRARVHGESEHVFCSVACMRQWTAANHPAWVAQVDEQYG